jgi:hypothetical protein
MTRPNQAVKLLDMSRLQMVKTLKPTTTSFNQFESSFGHIKVLNIKGLQPILSMQVLSNNIWYKYLSSSTSISIYMWIIDEVQLLCSDTGINPSPISEGIVEKWISIHLARENLTTRRTHGLSDLTYGYLLLSPSEVEIGSLHLGWNLGSTVITQSRCHPELPHSPSNNHHRVAVMVWPSSYISY